MTQLPEQRDTHLTPEEIVAEALSSFELGSEPSVDGLASSLSVPPAEIYRHFSSTEAIIGAAIDAAWAEATTRLLELIPKPFEAEPEDVLVATGVATRRTWQRHAYLASYMAASPESNDFTGNALALMANLFERLGLDREEAAACFHTYASFMIGAVLFTATRKVADEQLAAPGSNLLRFRSRAGATTSRRSNREMRRAMDEVMDLDDQHDEELFARGLRRLVDSFKPRGD